MFFEVLHKNMNALGVIKIGLVEMWYNECRNIGNMRWIYEY